MEDSFNPCSCLFLRWHKSAPTNPVFFSCFLAKSPPLIPNLSTHTYTLTCQKGHVPKVFLPSQLADTVWLLKLGNYQSRRLLDCVSCWVIYSVAVHFICPPAQSLPLLHPPIPIPTSSSCSSMWRVFSFNLASYYNWINAAASAINCKPSLSSLDHGHMSRATQSRDQDTTITTTIDYIIGSAEGDSDR